MFDPDEEPAEGLEPGMNVEVELCKVSLSTVTDCVIHLISSVCGHGERSKEISDEGKFHK